MDLEGIDHVALSVQDVDRAAQWYIDVLGFERRFEGAWNGIPTFIGKGSTAIALFPLREDKSAAQPQPKKRGMLHLAFRADAGNFAVAQSELKQRKIRFEFQDHDISHSIYFRDLDGNELEITTYEI
jgi:catechol-2,3-dioxygenase